MPSSFFLSLFGSLIEICLVSDAVLACEDPPAACCACAFARSAAAACASAEVELTGTSPKMSIMASSSSSSSPYSFHSSICSRSWDGQYGRMQSVVSRTLTATTSLNLTRPGIFFPLDRLCQIRRAFSFVAMSTALKGILFAFRIVSIRDVAVMMWDEPAVREV